MNAKCAECKKEITPSKAFEVLSKKMCSTKCCREYREREDAKRPKQDDTIYHKPDFHCSTF